ncbi:metallophosphoesterase [Peribacillus sp. SCS-37]|uniref:metallophosphoesterase n=1 Tax=Paraperibacillus esterisolvens TaxID=3115296 RepID=UPI00390676DC
MKALIVSDSHGLSDELQMLKGRHADSDLFIHCGDSELDPGEAAAAGFLMVKGNCDFTEGYPNSITKEHGGFKFFITHGHLYNVKMTVDSLIYKAEEEDAGIICFGHSHLAGSEMIEGRLYINPGSIRLPKGIKEKTYAVLEAGTTTVKVQFYNLEGNPLEFLTNTYQFE